MFGEGVSGFGVGMLTLVLQDAPMMRVIVSFQMKSTKVDKNRSSWELQF